MNRLKDYAHFAAWFAGLGYVVLWPLLSLGRGGAILGSTVICRADAALLRVLCNPADPLLLPPALHIIGLVSAIFITVNLLLTAVRMSASRRAPAVQPPKQAKFIMPRLRHRKRPLARVKPRTHFGLRGTPR